MVREPCGLGCSPFARHYSGNHCCFLFLPLLRCFSSRRSPHKNGNGPSVHWVAPFGDPGIRGHLHLPRAYRSLSRPSSPSRAKASACCPFLLRSFCSYSDSSAAKDGGLRTCSIKLRVIFNLAIKFWILICPSSDGGRRLYLLHYLKLFSICQRSSVRADRWGCLQLRTALFHLASLDPESPGIDKQQAQGAERAALYHPALTAVILVLFL